MITNITDRERELQAEVDKLESETTKFKAELDAAWTQVHEENNALTMAILERDAALADAHRLRAENKNLLRANSYCNDCFNELKVDYDTLLAATQNVAMKNQISEHTSIGS